MSTQSLPFPVKPNLQVQTKEPNVFEQTAWEWQIPSTSVQFDSFPEKPKFASIKHSSISSQLEPFPVKPVLQVQLKDPGKFKQLAFE